MSSPYTQQLLKVIVAQVCQNIGWNSIQTTPLELLGDILHKYLQEVSHQTHRYSELYGRSEPNLDDVALAFRDMNVVTADLEDYIANVDPVPCAIDVPKYPHHKDNHLNFLKPGCKEVVTRPVHVHEHLPPMYPEKEEEEVAATANGEILEDSNGNITSVIKDDKDLLTSPDSAAEASRLRTLSETEVRLTREITSVMMTTSGFISPAREGKLPDSKAPFIQTYDYPKPPPREPILIPPSAPPAIVENQDKPSKKKRPSDKRDKVPKDLFKAKVEPMGPPPPKQMPPLAAAIFPPSDSPMAAVVEKQQSQKRKSTSKERKHKQKDASKGLNKSGEARSSKKKKKQLVEKMEKPWAENMSMTGIAPIVPIYATPFNDTQMKSERPLTPDIPQNMFLPEQQMPPIFNLPAGTTGVLTAFGQQPPTPSIYNNPNPNQFEGKLASEPDKHKMNIFKRISSSKNKDEIVKSMLPPNLNLPETSIFPIDDTPYQQPLPTMKNNTSPKKQNFSHLPFKHEEQPLNMSMPKQLQIVQSFDLTTSPTGSPYTSPSHVVPPVIGKPKKEPKPKKVREKKPPKVREKKVKTVDVPNWPNILQPDGQPASMVFPPMQVLPPPPKPIVPKKLAGHLPPTLGNIDEEFNSMSQFMGPVPWFPGGAPGLIPMAPLLSGPGLIPNPEFFPGFPLHGYPFGGPPSMGHLPAFGAPNPNMRPDYPLLKRPRLDEESYTAPVNAPIEIEKVKCNVAPLVPESLKLSDELEIISTENIKPHKSRTTTINNPHKSQTSPAVQMPNDSIIVPQESSLTSHKRRRSTMSPPKTPVIDQDVQSISDDELPDDMDLEDISPRVNLSPQPVVPPHKDQIVVNPSESEKKDKSAAKLEKKRDKENRKKDKEGKIKKKKDKKNKSKSLDKSEKRKGKEEKKRDKEAKERLKKEKREKKREKERLAGLAAGGLDAGTTPAEGAARLGFGGSLGPDGGGHAEMMVAAAVPKLTLKLGQSPRPMTPELHRKISIKPPKKDRLSEMTTDHISDSNFSHGGREPSPELARFSALVTRPPKQKTPSTNEPTTPGGPEDGSMTFQRFSPMYQSDSNKDDFNSGDERQQSPSKYKVRHAPSQLSHRSQSPFTHQGQTFQTNQSTNHSPFSNPNSRVSVDSRSSSSQHHQHRRHHHRHGHSHRESPQRPRTPSPTPHAQRAPHERKFNSRPQSQPNDSAGNTIDASVYGQQLSPAMMAQTVSQNHRQSSYIDAEGNQVWICPACGRIDDGTPMIGCDGCDAWYHWVCVGIQVPPDTNEDWYCRLCIAKKQEQAGSDKKKKRKKKDKKDH